MNTTPQTADQYAGHQENVVQQAPGARMQENTMNSIRDPRRKSSFIAALLSFVPGLGQVYVGYYRRGFINILVFGSVFSLLVSTNGNLPFTPLGIMFLVFFEFYNIIDASRRATLFNLSLEGIEQIDLPDELTNKPMAINGSYLLGAVLVIGGAIALSNTLFGITLQWLEYWWPVAPIGFGLYLVYLAWKDKQEESGDEKQDVEIEE
jgi:hypothetical protein